MSTGSIPDALSEVLRTLVERGRETSEQINDRVTQAAVERMAEPLAQQMGEHLTQLIETEVAARVEAELEPLRSRIAALEERVGTTPS